MTRIRDLFDHDISRQIEEVIKVDQTDEELIYDEIQEYVFTESIKKNYLKIYEKYRETPNKPHEGIGIWGSGFFGSGKSIFVKMLGLALEDQEIKGEQSSELFAARAGDNRLHVLLKSIVEHIPTEVVMFDVSTERGIKSANQTLTEIMYKSFLKKLGYARDLDLAEHEMTLEEEGQLETFKQTYKELFNKDWDREKDKVSRAFAQASRVMQAMNPDLYPASDSWVKSAQNRTDISPGELAQRAKKLMELHRPNHTLVFVIDEVGQFVARDVQKMLDLQGIVQSLGRVGRGKIWLVVTAQEKLTEIVSGLDDNRVELARLMDRFPEPLQVHLEPSDISEVTSKRVLAKNAQAQKQLRELFTQNRGRLTDNTRLSADVRLPELTADGFIDLYPLLPYQVDLIIQVVSGLRTQGGAMRHVGGANRTIIKLAQQLLIRPDVDLANQEVGTLARADQIYDLVSGNISSEIREKISDIGKKIDHPMAQAVAKTICLFQYVRSIHRTAENIAAALHPSVEADSKLSEVKAALQELESALMVRQGNEGYRIPSPAEDDWEQQRARSMPKVGESFTILKDILTEMWQPPPSFTYLGTKVFKAGLTLNDKVLLDQDIPFQVALRRVGGEFDQECETMRTRSQTETSDVFWVVPQDEKIDREVTEIFRSKEILRKKERGAKTQEESSLVYEEKTRLKQHQEDLKRLVHQAFKSGAVYFRGNNRTPEDGFADIRKGAEKVLEAVVPDVFDRYPEAAAKVRKQDLEALMTSDNLRGLPQVFTDLGVITEQSGQPVFRINSGPLAEIQSAIENRTSYGETASGSFLTDRFAKEPYGWDFDVVRLLAVCLLRAGKVEITSKGQVIENAMSPEAKNNLPNNNLFRQASFRPRQGDTSVQDWLDADQAFSEVFGKNISELQAAVVASSIREEIGRHEQDIRDAHLVLTQNNLPGREVLEEALNQIAAITRGKDDSVIRTFNGAYKEIGEAIKRAGELNTELTEPRIFILQKAQKGLQTYWPFLKQETDLDPEYTEKAQELEDLLNRETFFRDVPRIESLNQALEQEYSQRKQQAAHTRKTKYQQALERLQTTPGWEDLNPDQQESIAENLTPYMSDNPDSATVPQIRSDIDACPTRLNKAFQDMVRLLEEDQDRVVEVYVSDYLQGSIETQEQLENQVNEFKDECEKLLGAGKKVLIQ